MMPFWTERPDRPPFRCSLTLQDDPSVGPFYSTGLSVFAAVSSPDGIRPGNPETVYLSPQAIREICAADGSPLAVFTADEDADRNAELEALQSENAEQAARIEELSAQVAELEGHVNPEQLADALVVKLEDHFARKSGPKPRRPEAA